MHPTAPTVPDGSASGPVPPLQPPPVTAPAPPHVCPTCGGRNSQPELHAYIHPLLPTWLARTLVGGVVLGAVGLFLNYSSDALADRKMAEKELRNNAAETRRDVSQMNAKLHELALANGRDKNDLREDLKQLETRIDRRLEGIDKKLDNLEKQDRSILGAIYRIIHTAKDDKKTADDAKADAQVAKAEAQDAKAKAEQADAKADEAKAQAEAAVRKSGRSGYMKPPSKTHDQTDPGTKGGYMH